MPLMQWYWPVAAAPFVGSFLTVLITRPSAGRSVVWGRSTCDHCGHPLGIGDLVPIASWLAAGGRCRYCDAPVAALYAGVEAAALAAAVWAAALTAGASLWLSCALAWCLLALAVIDVREGLLPDALTFPLLLIGLAAAIPEGRTDLLDRGIGAIAGFASLAVTRVLYRRIRGREGLGLGDAKLLGAAGAWVSWEGLPSVVLIGSIVTLTWALAERWRGRPVVLDQRIPFGPGLCLGAWIVWLYGPLG
jgi:leader peptidase (prepilin peptidase)/N-methyltransferase